MYCKTTYGNKTSSVNQEGLRCTAPYFHEEKENLYTFYARMQENHNPNCPKWCGQPFTENYCTNCSRRDKTENVENQYVNEDELGHNKQDYVTVLKPRRASRSTDSARGSMYGCDHVNVKDVPLYKDINKKRVCETNDNQGNTTNFSKGNLRNCTETETSKEYENHHLKKVDSVEQISCRGNFYKIDDIGFLETVRSASESDKKTSMKEDREPSHSENLHHRNENVISPENGDCDSEFDENTTGNSKGGSKQSWKCENSEKVKSNYVKGKTLAPEKNYPKGVERHETSFGFAKNEKKASRKCTSSEEVETKLGKCNSLGPEKEHLKSVYKNHASKTPQDSTRGNDSNEESKSNIRKNMNTDSKADDLSTAGKGKKFQADGIADKSKQSASVKAEKGDAKKAYKAEAFQQEDTDNQAKSVRNEETAKPVGHGARDRSRVSRGSKRMPRRRVQKRPQTHPSNSEKPANGGVDEWLLFVVDSIKKGVFSALLAIPSYLSAGWSLLAYFPLVLILLVLFVLSCIQALLKSCAAHLWNALPFLRAWVHSLRERVFHKEDKTTHNTFKSGPPPTRQRSDPLPEANELVSRLLASKDLNAYEILGVSASSATDEEIKRSYRDMAKVVHPDKNPHQDASEAFKILQSAFDAISDEQKRLAYEFNKDRKRLEEEMEEFFENFMEKVQEMKNKIMCRACQKSHPRLPTDRLIFAARYCSDCGVRHPAREGDVWVETSHMGFKYYCFLCMNGQVYEVTEWGSCQGLLRLKANSHNVFISVRSNHHSPWDDMFGDDDRSGNSKKKRKSKGKSNKNKKR